jgi:hypothetical protein
VIKMRRLIGLILLAGLLVTGTARAQSVGDASAVGVPGSAAPPQGLFVGGTDGTNFRPLSVNLTGALNLNTADPCQNGIYAKSSIPLALTASAQLIAASGSTSIYVCGFAATAAGTSPTLQFEYGTGTTCGTGTTVLTGAFAPTAGSFIGALGAVTQFTVPSGSNLCAILGGTTPSVQGYLTYVQR